MIGKNVLAATEQAYKSMETAILLSKSKLDQYYYIELEGAVLLQMLVKARSALFSFVMACGSTCMNSGIKPAQTLSQLIRLCLLICLSQERGDRMKQ